MTANEKHDYLEGQMTGVIIALRKLIETTPYPDATRQVLLKSINEELAAAQDLNASQHYLSGLRSSGMWLGGGG